MRSNYPHQCFLDELCQNSVTQKREKEENLGIVPPQTIFFQKRTIINVPWLRVKTAQ